jgi:hypothetical protein
MLPRHGESLAGRYRDSGHSPSCKRLIQCPWKSGIFFPNVGMGVVFTNVEEDQLAVLRKWLSELSGSKE